MVNIKNQGVGKMGEDKDKLKIVLGGIASLIRDYCDNNDCINCKDYKMGESCFARHILLELDRVKESEV